MQTWLHRNGDRIELILKGGRMVVEFSEPVHLSTLGFGFLDKSILRAKSRYRCKSDSLRLEIESCLLPPSGRRKSFSDPKISKLDAVTQSVLDAANGQVSSVALLHVMRGLATSTYNYNEFLGDRSVTYVHGNLGHRLAEVGLRYEYVPLPAAGPTQQVLKRLNGADYGWDEFKVDYRKHLTPEVLAETTSWILRSLQMKCLPVLFCCEPFVTCFDKLAPEEKAEYGCHRFLLAEAIAQALQGIGLATNVEHLNPSEVRFRMGN